MRKRGVVLNGELLTKLYTRKGWSQQDFAFHAGLDTRTIAKIKRGGSCDTRTLQILSATLDVLPQSLLAEEFSSLNTRVAVQDDVDHIPSSPKSVLPSSDRFRLVHLWKVIDFRKATNPADMHSESDGDQCTTVWNWYQIQKLSEHCEPYLFPFLTWGDRIDCTHAPDGVTFGKVQVAPGDLVHSDKQWELAITPPDGPLGSTFDCGPIGLRYVNAFHAPGQQWWQTRISGDTDILMIQIWFRPEQRCLSAMGEWAAPGDHRFRKVDASQPQCLPDGSVVTWLIQKPLKGAFYKLSWTW